MVLKDKMVIKCIKMNCIKIPIYNLSTETKGIIRYIQKIINTKFEYPFG